MANETQIGQLVIDLKIKMEALEKGLESAKKKLQEIEKQNEQVKNSNSNLNASFIAMSAGIVASLAKIKSAISDGIGEYKKYESANKGLESIVKGQGLNFNKAQTFIDEYISDGLIPLSEATLAYKNLASRGYNEEQIKQTMISLKDAAAFGRQSTYEYGEAIATATEGLKNENSILVDNAGVTKNVAKMWQDYAKSIGKTTDSLTQEEKIQAEVNGIQEESKNQIGDAAKYAETYAGQQAQANASSLELSRTLGETMMPVLTEINSLGLSLTKRLTNVIENNKGVTAGTVTFVTSLGTLVLGITAVIKVMQSYKTAVDTLNMSTKTLKTTMASAFAVSAVLAGIAAITTAIREQKEAQKELSEAQEFHNQVVSRTIELNNENVNSIQTKKKEMEDYLAVFKDYDDNETTIAYAKLALEMGATGEAAEEFKRIIEECTNENITLGASLVENSDKFKKLYKIEKDGLVTEKELNKHIQVYTERINEANAIEKIKTAIDTETIKKQQQEAAQLKVNVQTMQDYLNIVKKGDTSTTDYQNAVKKLAKAYPESANAEGIIIDKAQDYINVEQAKADQAWNTSQTTINGSIEVINTFMEMARQAENDAVEQQKLANAIGISYANIIPTLTSVLTILSAMGNAAPAAVTPEVAPFSTKKTSGGGGSSSKSYENKALDNYKKQIEHKKALEQISLQQEIAMYQTALNKYAKTQDEKWELTEKIYSLEKELKEKNLDDYTEMIEHRKALEQISLQDEINMYQYAYNSLAKTTEQKREIEEKLHDLRKELAQKDKELLEQKTTEYQRYIQDQKNLRGAEYDTKEQERDLNKIIQIHKNYLNQIMKDERLSLEERKEIYQEELDVIRDYEQQKRDLRVQSVDDTVSQLTSAITKQLEEMEEADKKAIEDNIKLVEKWKETRINAINEEYEARIEAIQKELDLLDKSEEDKTRAEEDAEYERKKNRLEQLIAYEHDATTKANYQKELDKLVAEYQKTLDKRTLQDKKDALKEQQDLLKEEQDNKVQAIEDEADRQKEEYDKQLDQLEEYYNKQKDLAQETAEKMLLNVEKNQNQILKLLNSYGNAYEITGQSLGEKLAQGINNGIAGKIQNIIQKIQDTIDAGIENKIKEWTAGMYKYEAGINKPQTKTVSVTQQNYIQQNPEMPSETYRKLNNISEGLAAEIAGM